jgi:carboxypeptidase Taq
VTGDVYEQLAQQYEKVFTAGTVDDVLSWDQQVMMPPDGSPVRSKQRSLVSSIRHDLLTDDRTGELLDQVDDEALDDERRGAVREIRRQYERSATVPGDLVEKLAETRSDAQGAWQEAKANDDFDHFAPVLERVRDLNVERAEHVDPDTDPFEVMHRDHRWLPYVDMETVEEILEELREVIVPMLEDIRSTDVELATPFAGGDYPDEKQMELSERALDVLGYPWNRGRLDLAPHPFISGSQYDCRLTTRFKDHPLKGLMATIHEYGHTTYQHGLPKKQFGNPLGESFGMSVHESQSRFWENHVGRSRAFWELFLPEVKDVFPHLEDVTVNEAYEAVNRVNPDNLIRVEADELTYHMHIILRFETGREFVRGEIDVDEIPQVWNERMEEYLGIVPKTEADGCLQDIHWTRRFASFHGYTIGSVLAAQLDATMRDELDDVEGKIRDGDFEPLRSWMGEKIHQHGRRFPTDELIERATGEPLTADYFIDHVEEKFSNLYGI